MSRTEVWLPCVLGLVPLGPHREGRLFEYRASPPIHEFEWNHTGAPPSSCHLCDRLIDWSMLFSGIISQIQRRRHGLLEGNSLSLGFSQCWAWSSQQDGRGRWQLPIGFQPLNKPLLSFYEWEAEPSPEWKGIKDPPSSRLLFFFLVTSQGMWDPSCPTRGRTCGLRSESMKS